MSSLVGGTGIIGQDIVCGFGNGKYKTFEGTEISIENCLKAKIKDLVVEGKTIQDTEDLSNIESVTERENNILSVKVNDNTTTLNLLIPLRSLPNGVADTIEGNKLVQRVGKVVYNGSEDWKLGVTTGNVPVFYLVSANLKGLSSLICDTYTVQTTTKDKSIYCGNAWRPQIRDDTCATVEDFKAYLTENPVTVYYELATPIIHSLEIPQLATTKGTNIITTTNNIKPNLKIKVKVK